MAFEDIQAEIANLLNLMEDHPKGKLEIHEQVREKLNELKAFGLPLPEDLVLLEQELERELSEGDTEAEGVPEANGVRPDPT
ncbi:MAG: hypothetical protein ACRDRT_19340 [Pseudonocardiaceae bacterium]